MSKDNDFLDNYYTPNTYDTNFKTPPQSSGVYFIVKPTPNYKIMKHDYDILYIGSSKNLYERYSNHEVLRILKKVHGYIQFFFKETENYLQTEKQLIKKYQPRFNTQWL